MKLSKNWKRIIAGFMAVAMVFLSIDTGAITAFAMENSNEKEVLYPELPTGGVRAVECIEKIQLDPSEIVDYNDLIDGSTFSVRNNSFWNECSTYYYYNQLDSEWKKVWDTLEVICFEYLTTEKDFFMGQIANIAVPANSTDEDVELFINLFIESNPQYYFFNNWYSLGYVGESINPSSFSLHVYNAFKAGDLRAEATEKFEVEIQKAISAIQGKLLDNATDEERLKEIHSYVIRMTEYNDTVLEDDDSVTSSEEEAYFTQSAYSGFCLKETVCAGYAECMQLLCNRFGLETVNVTSFNHKWNKVRINDSWYNVDATWSDAGEAIVEEYGENFAIVYEYYGRSDAFYEGDHQSHVMNEEWEEYVPLCVQDTILSAPDSINPSYELRTFSAPRGTVSTPQITVIKAGDNTYRVEINVLPGKDNEFEDVEIYYTLDGTEPSCASTKSYIYTETFIVEGDYNVKAVAVLDGYWDSAVANEEKVLSVKNPVINDHFYNKMTFKWDVLENATGYILDIYQGTEKLNSNKIKTELINNKNTNTYVLDTSSFNAGTNIFYEIRAYVDDVTNVSEGTISQIHKTKSQPLNVNVQWHVTKIENVDYIVINVEELLDGNATLQDEMWIWYYSDISKINPDASFKIDLSGEKKDFMYTYSEHGIPFDETGYLYVTNEDKSSAFQETAFAIGGEYVEPELLPIEDVVQTEGESIVLEAVLSPDKIMDNFKYTYQWYVAKDEFAKGTAIEGATKDSYKVQIGSFDEKFYYCEVTAEYGTKKVYTTSNGTVSETGEKEHTRVSGELFGSEVTISPIENQEYTGSEIAPELNITDKNTGKTLILGEDYTVTYSNNINAKKDVEGIVDFIGDYSKAKDAKVYFDIVPKNVENDTTIDVYKVDDVIYTGSAYTPNGEVWDLARNVKLVENVDYKVSFSNNKDAGPAVVMLNFIGNYTGTRFINFIILPKDISNEEVTISNNSSKTYTGYAIIPNLVLEYGAIKLEYGKDFELICINNINVGTATVEIRFIGNYAGSKETTFTIVQKDSSDLIIDNIANQEYTGHAITPSLKIIYSNPAGAVVLQENTDYTVTYTNNVNQGTARVEITFKGNYTGTRTVEFSIVSRSAENLICEDIPDVSYTGEELMPKPVIKNGNLLLEEGKDYELSYSNNINAGEDTAIITATFKGNYHGTREIYFTILPREAENCKVEFAIPNQVYSYTGKIIKPAVIVKDGEKVLVEGSDYTVAYNYDKNVGKKKVEVDFMGNYTGTSFAEFSIISKSVTAADLVIEGIHDFIYNGAELIPEITIMDKSLGELLREGFDYVITVIDNIFAGIATIRIEFINGGNYIAEEIVKNFTIFARSTENVVIDPIPEYRYTGDVIKPKLNVRDTKLNITLTEGTDYTVDYKDNVNEGTAKVTVSFIGNFVGNQMTSTFTIINPVPTTITSSTFHINQSNGYISKITVGTTVSTLWSKLNEKDYVVIYDKNGNVVNASSVLCTGMTAAIMDEGTLTKKYTIVVTGDTNGDGKINITDMIAVKASTLKKSDLSGVYEKAGDVNGDGKINITDFIKVKATTLKKDTITGVAVK